MQLVFGHLNILLIGSQVSALVGLSLDGILYNAIALSYFLAD